MAKKQSEYVCKACSAQSSTWSGKCYSCGEWNTLEEIVTAISSGKASSGTALRAETSTASARKDAKRIVTNIRDIDTVFGGGIVPGSVVLLAGEPGIGKSTILLQIANDVADKYKVLYVSGEESAHQVGMRADRLSAAAKNLLIASSTSAEDAAASITSKHYDLVVVDSIQTMNSTAVSSSAGSVSQITTCTHLLLNAAKQSQTAVILVG